LVAVAFVLVAGDDGARALRWADRMLDHTFESRSIGARPLAAVTVSGRSLRACWTLRPPVASFERSLLGSDGAERSPAARRGRPAGLAR
jgi:hypothetical protein